MVGLVRRIVLVLGLIILNGVLIVLLVGRLLAVLVRVLTVWV